MERASPDHLTSPIPWTSNTINVANYGADLTGSNDSSGAITDGTGTGQSRLVSSYSNTAGTVTIGSPWNVPPDSSSTVVIGDFVKDMVAYKNNLSGQPVDCLPYNNTNSDGVIPYGGLFDLVVDSNLFTSVGTGVNENSFGQQFNSMRSDSNAWPAQYMEPNYFHLILNNTMSNCRVGIGEFFDTDLTGQTELPAVYSLGHVFRNDNISGSTATGIHFQVQTWVGPPNNNTLPMGTILFDGETVNSCPTAVYISDPGGYSANLLGTTIFTGNTLTLGSPSNPGTNPLSRGSTWPTGVAMDSAYSANLEVSMNTYTGNGTWGQVYGSTTLPGPVPEILQRNIVVSGAAAGSAVTGDLPVYNMGTASLSATSTVTTSDGSNWLTVSPNPVSVPDESAPGLLSYTCDPTHLTAKTYTGTITLSSGSGANTVTRSYYITFNVGQTR